MQSRFLGTVLTLVIACGTCGDNPADVDELRKGQQQILDQLAALDDALQQVQQQRTASSAAPAKPALDPNKVYSIPLSNSPTRGASDAKVTLVEFADYQCPFSAQAEGLVRQVLAAYPKDVRLVYKQFPLASIHPQATSAARAAVAAGRQGRYWEMHDLLFKNQRQLSPEMYVALAQKLQLDVTQFQQDVDSAEVVAQVTQEMREGKGVEVAGTPTLFVNGRRVVNRSFDGLAQMIAAARGGPPG
jgi:protein-disulfide isomerase